MSSHWNVESSAARQAAAADLWLELTGRKNAVAMELAKEGMARLVVVHAEKRADFEDEHGTGGPAPSPTRKRLTALQTAGLGAGVGGALGAGGAGLAAHLTKSPRALAALGGGVAGAGLGATAGAAHALYRMYKDQAGAQAKTGSAATEAALTFFREHPNVAKGTGALAAAVPIAGLGYAIEKRRHTPGEGGESRFQIRARHQQAEHEANVAHSKKNTPGQRLKSRYLAAKVRAADEAAANPRRSGAIGSSVYGLTAALPGASIASRVLK